MSATITAVPYSRSTSCPFCRVPAVAKCVTAAGKERDNHRARWELIAAWYRGKEMVFEMREDDERFGLSKGDLLICINYPYDAKVTVIRRLSDGLEPQCNQYTHSVKFVGWATDAAA